MTGQRHPCTDRGAKRSFRVHPKAFVFFDKTTRIQRFEVKARADGSMPYQEAATLLAMHCVLHGQDPKDFSVMVAVGDNLLNGMGRQVSRLIHACLAMQHPIPLTRRQHEVLRGVLQSRTNKEIADQLNISLRTVKFHVTSLFTRFEVTDRMSLAQKTAEMLSAGELFANVTPFPPATQNAASEPAPANSRERQRLLPMGALDKRSRA